MSKLFIPLFLIIAFSGCSSDKCNVNLQDVDSTSVKLTEISFKEEPPLFPKGCMVKDSLLIMFEPKDKDGFLHIYSTETNRFIKKLGKKGRGQNEFMLPRLLGNGKFKSDKNCILLGDINGIYSVNISSDHYEKVLHTALPEDLSQCNYILENTDNVLTVNQTGEYQLTFYDKRNDEVSFKNYFDESLIDDDLPDFDRVTQAFDAYYSANDENIMIAYKNFKVIDLVSLKSKELTKRIYFPMYDSNQSKISVKNGNVSMDKGAKLFFTYIYPTDNCFYALSWDADREEIENATARSTIYKISNSGEIDRIYKIDQPISSFCLDQSGNIYAIGIAVNGELHIYRGKMY